MTKLNEIYKCNVCGNTVSIVNTGIGELVCCGIPMELVNVNSVDATLEKHVPVIEKTDTGIKVKVGSIAHPMTEDHYIQWIEVVSDKLSYKKFLKPGDTPEALFNIQTNKITVRAYCNLHGLWKNNS